MVLRCFVFSGSALLAVVGVAAPLGTGLGFKVLAEKYGLSRSAALTREVKCSPSPRVDTCWLWSCLAEI